MKQDEFIASGPEALGFRRSGWEETGKLDGKVKWVKPEQDFYDSEKISFMHDDELGMTADRNVSKRSHLLKKQPLCDSQHPKYWDEINQISKSDLIDFEPPSVPESLIKRYGKDFETPSEMLMELYLKRRKETGDLIYKSTTNSMITFKEKAQLVAKVNCPTWIEDNKEETVYLLMEIGDALGMNFVEAVQSIILYNGYVCVRAKTLKALTEARNDVEWNISESGSIANKDYAVRVETDKGVTVLGFPFLVQAGLYDPEFPADELPSISQKYPERTLKNKAFAYHYADYHKIIGVEILEEIKSYDPSKPETLEGSHMAATTADKKKTEKIFKQAKEMTEAAGDMNPLLNDQVDLEENIRDVELEEFLKKVDDEKLKAPPILAFFQENYPEEFHKMNVLKNKKTAKFWREGLSAIQAGQFDNHYKAIAPAGEVDPLPEIEKEEPQPQEAPKQEAPEPEPDSKEAPPSDERVFGWFYNADKDRLHNAPMEVYEEMIKESYLLGVAKTLKKEEGLALLNDFDPDKKLIWDNNEFLWVESEPEEVEPSPEPVAEKWHPKVKELEPKVTEILKGQIRSMTDMSPMWMGMHNMGILDAVEAQIKKNGFEMEDYLSNRSKADILELVNGVLKNGNG